MNQVFELSTDASDFGFGCILSQRDSTRPKRPVHFLSKTFSGNELAWHTRDKEAFAFVYALGKFKHYLLGKKFIWYTDHRGLQWLRNTRDPRGIYARWLEEVEEFEFDIRYRPGAYNPHADALSRRCKGGLACSILSSQDVRSTKEVKRAQASDPVLSQVIARLRLNENREQPSNRAVRTWLRR
ncbi:Hypothetical predicted protein [Paramuricea clavata]|uniref:Reverse transcriptase RNase H-like domain-containing protein n=1 Tax=Paramuricea clavata TaxID=317549 RepID=A0A7D9HDS2_PARCT|nr:Hypothetical predicted protein [Paramuricea clavata]